MRCGPICPSLRPKLYVSKNGTQQCPVALLALNCFLFFLPFWEQGQVAEPTGRACPSLRAKQGTLILTADPESGWFSGTLHRSSSQTSVPRPAGMAAPPGYLLEKRILRPHPSMNQELWEQVPTIYVSTSLPVLLMLFREGRGYSMVA